MLAEANVLLLLAFLEGATSVYSLACHCLNGSQCESNGFCANGCQLLWSGPGCQVGNVAFNKSARQSTNYSDNFMYSASAAVDGIWPADSEKPHFCSNTAAINPAGAVNGFSWWFVTLDLTHYYVIYNVTLLNRGKNYNDRLSNFVILYSNESDGDPIPNTSTWLEFARENGMVGDSRTYTRNNTVIAKRVAVYLMAFNKNPEAILTLCEVQVIGYELNVCQRGYTGPGCLLRACDDCNATGGKCTRDFGSCRYEVCPDQSFLSPDCWITASSLSGLDVRSTATCNSVLFSAVLNDTQPNIAASWLQLQVTTSADRQLLENAQLSLQGTNSVYYNFSNATSNTAYNVSFKLLYCDNTKSSCFSSTGSREFTVVTSRKECPYSTSAAPKENITGAISAVAHGAISEVLPGVIGGVLPGALGGSVALIAITVVIVAVIYRRRQQNANTHAPAVELDRKRTSPLPASSLDPKILPSYPKEQCDNPYESLHNDLQLNTAGDYASLH